jgi:DnaJ-class molecular chaperone
MERTDQQPPQPSPQPCTGCNGAGGTTVDTIGRNGARISTWHSCNACGGSGRKYG